MASLESHKRLQREYLKIMKNPPPYITAVPLPSNILEWHYCVKGPEDSPYHGGYYHGKLVFPSDYPYKPPAVYMITPSGRFKCNTRLCLSLSDFHPEAWHPAWSVSSILIGLLSFMCETTVTTGSIETSDGRKRELAYKSLEYNLANPKFVKLFPDLSDAMHTELEKRREDEAANGGRATFGDSGRGSRASGGNKDLIANLVLLLGLLLFLLVANRLLDGQEL